MTAHDNHIVLLGNIVSKHPQLKYYADGTAMLALEVITKRKWRDKEGQWQEHATYFNVSVLGADAELISKDASAGQGIYIRACIRQHHNGAQVKNTLQALEARLLNKATAINWNQAHLVGNLMEHSSLVQTINGLDLMTLTLDISSSEDKPVLVEVKLKGATAKVIASQMTAQDTQVAVFVEGTLNGQSKKVADEFVHQYWIEGHTCVIS